MNIIADKCIHLTRKSVLLPTSFGRRGMVWLLAAVIYAGLLALTGAQSWAQIVTATLPVGSFPQGIVVNPVTNNIYVVNEDSNNVTVIDGATNKKRPLQ